MPKNVNADSLSSLPNLGKVTIKKLEQIDIKTVEELLARDPYDIFEELLLKVDPTLCRCALAGIVGAKKMSLGIKSLKKHQKSMKGDTPISYGENVKYDAGKSFLSKLKWAKDVWNSF